MTKANTKPSYFLREKMETAGKNGNTPNATKPSKSKPAGLVAKFRECKPSGLGR